MHTLFARIIRHPFYALLLSVLLAAPFLASVPSVKTVDNVDYFTPDDDPEMVFYNQFKDIFGNDEFFIVAFQDEHTIFTRENLEAIKDLTEEFEALDGVRKVISLANVDHIVGGEYDFLVQKFLETIPDDPEEITALKQKALTNNLYRKNLISIDGKTTAITVFPHERPEDEGFRKTLVSQTMDILKAHEPEKRFHLAGMTITNLRLSQFMKKDLSIFIPISYLVIILTMFVIFRDIKIVALSFFNITICLGTTFGFISMIGSTINNITSIVPSLVMAICLADSIHIFSKFLSARQQGDDVPKAVESTLMGEYRPCFLTSITTVIGFLSLRFSNLPPIQEFALIAAFGVCSAYVFSFLLLPSLIVMVKPGKNMRRQRRYFAPVLTALADFSKKRYLLVAGVSAGFFLLSLAMVPHIKTETNLLNFFKEKTQLRQSIDFVENHLSGVETIQISLKAETADAFVDPMNIRIIETVHKYLSEMADIDTANSYVDFIKEMHQAFHNNDTAFYVLPDNRNLISQYMLLYGSDDMDDYMNYTYDHARIVARTSVHGSTALGMMMDEIERYLQDTIPDNISYRITGESRKVVNVIDDLVAGQVASIAMAFVTISLLMFLVMKSFKLGMISLIPNIFPIAVNFLVMAAAGIPLNTATALISAIAIGIAVDDTIHFMYNYKNEFKKTGSVHGAITNTFMLKGNAIITTSIILFAGFGVLVFSSFVPTIQFGFLTAAIMVSVLVGDLLVAPSLLHLFAKGKKQ